MDKLKDVDEVAYVRFASVYRQFKDINTFVTELKIYLWREKTKMNNYITIQPIDEKIDFVNLAITLSNVNSKSREDMEVVCKDGNFNIKI